ncbi:IclR family transcriptional regulator [Ancylobacter mangrovi]|uniref:IclR family transcriptional regulator n=2 Tax=Ancylobacter mangrovi TaxID=2972472 RepID=A0A9X2T3T2_9HYPH|nr:IclR family transcriptional regulator [Ancylobacter mangrovi]MCS0497482.1 IclR family transcriptional regulator [Ancylobacter mangrovi]MCS0503968.1 IclR family transcriptional regulator [Ancylobacter mangrovi]
MRMTDAVTVTRRRGRPSSSGGTETGGEVQSLDRAIALLEVLALSDGMTLSEVARAAELPTSTVHRLLTTLERRGLVGHDPATGQWMVGLGLFRIGSAYLRIRKLPEIARGLLRELSHGVNETVNLSLIDGPHLICVAQMESHAAVRAFFRIGGDLPIHASGGGKAILAAMNPEARRAWLGGDQLQRFTEHTHVSRRALQADLATIAERGYSIDDEEHTPGMRCVAAAVLDEWREPVGAISISAPTVRMPPERIADLGRQVREAAQRLTTRYSGL